MGPTVIGNLMALGNDTLSNLRVFGDPFANEKEGPLDAALFHHIQKHWRQLRVRTIIESDGDLGTCDMALVVGMLPWWKRSRSWLWSWINQWRCLNSGEAGCSRFGR